MSQWLRITGLLRCSLHLLYRHDVASSQLLQCRSEINTVTPIHVVGRAARGAQSWMRRTLLLPHAIASAAVGRAQHCAGTTHLHASLHLRECQSLELGCAANAWHTKMHTECWGGLPNSENCRPSTPTAAALPPARLHAPAVQHCGNTTTARRAVSSTTTTVERCSSSATAVSRRQVADSL